MSPRSSSAPRAFASLVLAACVAGAPAVARAGCASDSECDAVSVCDLSASQPGVCRPIPGADARVGSIVIAGIGTGLSVFGLLWGVKTFDDWQKVPSAKNANAAEVALFSEGALGLVTGGLAIGLQASTSGYCGFRSICQASYGMGGGLLALGTAFTIMGIAVAVSPVQGHHSHGRVHWTPSFDVNAHGASLGVTFSGFDL